MREIDKYKPSFKSSIMTALAFLIAAAVLAGLTGNPISVGMATSGFVFSLGSAYACWWHSPPKPQVERPLAQFWVLDESGSVAGLYSKEEYAVRHVIEKIGYVKAVVNWDEQRLFCSDYRTDAYYDKRLNQAHRRFMR